MVRNDANLQATRHGHRAGQDDPDPDDDRDCVHRPTGDRDCPADEHGHAILDERAERHTDQRAFDDIHTARHKSIAGYCQSHRQADNRSNGFANSAGADENEHPSCPNPSAAYCNCRAGRQL